MTMSKRDEIDFREKLADEITREGDNLKLAPDVRWALNRAIAVVRMPIMHGDKCPCSLCKKWTYKTCQHDECDSHRKVEDDEIDRFISSMEANRQDLFYCGNCNNGRNEWKAIELLFDIPNEMVITPCCHTEATESLVNYDEEEAYDQRKDDEQSYRYSVTGRL